MAKLLGDCPSCHRTSVANTDAEVCRACEAAGRKPSINWSQLIRIGVVVALVVWTIVDGWP